jgi:hypothetical protein
MYFRYDKNIGTMRYRPTWGKNLSCLCALVWIGMHTFEQASQEPVLGGGFPMHAPSVSGATYYVSLDGYDTNPGTLALPWKTLQHAGDTARAGDTVLVRGGIYTEALILSRSGSAEDRITFEAFPDENPVIQGPSYGQGTAVRIHGSFIHFAGFEIRRCELGIEMTGHHIEISDCRIHDLVFGVSPHNGCHDFRLRGVDLYDFFLFGFDASRWDESEPSCHNGMIIACAAYDALDEDQNVDGFAFGDGHDFHFEQCTAYNVFDGFDIKADRTTLHRCSAFRCSNSGYKLWADGIRLINCMGWDNQSSHVELDWDGNPGTTTLMNCTFHDAHTFGVWVENSLDRLRMMNCILAGGRNIGLCFELESIGDYKGDHNMFHNQNPQRAVVVGYRDEFTLDQVAGGFWTQYSGQDRNSKVVYDIEQDCFADLISRDFHLDSGCLAVDAGGASEAPAVDFDCMQRPAGLGFDIGAFEFESILSPECTADEPEPADVERKKSGKHRK